MDRINYFLLSPLVSIGTEKNPDFTHICDVNST